MRLKVSLKQSGGISPTLQLSLLFSVLLLVGILAGVLVATALNLSAKQALFSDLNAFIYGDHSQTSFFTSLWQFSRMPLLIFCLSFTCFGIVAIPVSVALQGYLLSFSVSTMVSLAGWKGCLLGFSSFGIRAFILVPCILILSVQCFLLSKQFFCAMLPTKTGAVKFPRGFILAIVCCFLFLIIGAILDNLLTDHAVSFVLNHLIL